jgi:hypothetical protein
MSDIPSAPIASSIDSDNINTRHQRRMERKKALMDEKFSKPSARQVYC